VNDPFRALGFPTVPESREADRLGAQRGPRALIRDASLRVFCVDCARTVAAVTYVHGRALVTARALDDRLAPERRLGRHWQFSWLNRGPVVYARCDARQYVLGTAGLRQRTPAPGRRREPDWRVSHTNPDGVL
jgi:hypothetical protein